MKPRFSFWALIRFQAQQFCLNTALHGYRFIVLPRRVLLERVFWVIIALTSLVSALTLMVLAWINFQDNPTLLVTDSTHYPIWNYPFPAVSICSFNKLNKERVYAMAEKLEKPPEQSTTELAEEMRILFQLLFNNNEKISFTNYSRLQHIFEMNGLEIQDVMMELAPKCTEDIQRCKWKGEEKRCDSLFERIISTEGFCCSFNYYALRNHTFDGAMPSKVPKLPRRVSACGYSTALEVLVNTKPESYFATQIATFGHRILIHNPYHYPDWTTQNLLTETGVNNLIGITPTITYSIPEILGISVLKRKCIFANESRLFNFAEYSYHNCIIECRMNISRRLCGCIPFYFYHKNGDYPRTRICSLRDIACLTDYRETLMSSVPGFDFNDLKPDHKWGTEAHDCNCLPDCDYVDYAAEASAGIFTRKYATNQLNLFGGITIQHQSVVRVFFNDLVATKNRRDVNFTWHTLLAYYGGLLGVFTGFSFVSAVEFIYFFTVRLFLNLKEQKEKDARKNKSFSIRVLENSRHLDEQGGLQNARLFLRQNKLRAMQ